MARKRTSTTRKTAARPSRPGPGDRDAKLRDADVRAQLALLARRLDHGGDRTAIQAVQGLRSLGLAVCEHRAALRALARASGHRLPKVRVAAARILRRLAPQIRTDGELIELLAEEARYDSEEAASVLAWFGPTILDHPSMEELVGRWSHVRYPGENRDHSAAVTFWQRLRCGTVGREFCLRLIEAWRREEILGPPAAVEVIRARHRALAGHPLPLEVLLESLHDESEYLSDLALGTLIALARDGDDRYLVALIQALGRPISRYYVHPGDHYLDGVWCDLREKIPSLIATHAVRAASRPEVLDAIEGGLKCPNPDYRWWCARALTSLASEASEHERVSWLLADALLNWDPEVRRLAGDAVRRCADRLCRSPDVVHMFTQVRDHGAPDVRPHAEQFLSAP